MGESSTSQHAFQRECLNSPPGLPGSAKVRYAAAMHLHQSGKLSSAALEVYRTLAKDDFADPMVSLSAIGHDREVEQLMGKTHAVSALIDQIDNTLSGLDHPSIAEVRQGIAKWRASSPAPVQPQSLAACAFLPAALQLMQDKALAQSIQNALPLLKWISYDAYPKAEIGASFAEGHAYATLIGDGSFHQAADFDLGLFVIAPRVRYPDHKHAAPELYVPLTGPHGWRFLPEPGFQWLDANVPVWNEPWKPHATQTGDVPFLCIFCWTRDVTIPAEVIPGYGVNTRAQ